MTDRKLKTFEEKMNAFLKSLESGNLQYTSKSYFLEKYSYLDADEVEMLFNLGGEIRAMAVELAGQAMEARSTTFSVISKLKHKNTFEAIASTVQAALEARYPYLEEIRITRLVAHGIASYR